MIRTIEQVQKDIVQTTLEIQTLRRTQGLMKDNDLSSVRQRIQQLSIRLDGLYEEKRARQSLPPPTTPPVTENRQGGKATNRLIAQLFES
jgi:hypothetical protein